MPRQYPPWFRNDMLNRMLAGSCILSLFEETAVPDQTPHRWKQQARVEAGFKDGSDSQGTTDLHAANKRFQAFKKKLQPVKKASALFDAQGVTRPKKTGHRRETLDGWLFDPDFRSHIWGESQVHRALTQPVRGHRHY